MLETDRMRRLILAAAMFATVSGATLPGPAAFAEETCTGDNCPPPQSQGGGRDCESKKEPTVS
jgi:hypothetical protein